MSDPLPQSNQTIQAYATTAVGSLLTMTCMSLLPAEHVQYGVVSATLVTPFVALFFVRIYQSVNEPAELTKYKAQLHKDMKQQKKLIKNCALSAASKKEIQRKYDDTAIKLATANQDHARGTIVVEFPNGQL